MADPAARCMASVFGRLGRPGWWLYQSDNGRLAVQVLVQRVRQDELRGTKAPVSLQQRIVSLPAAAAGASSGDLVAFDRECWLLTGRPDPDHSGLVSDWVAMPFVPPPAFDGSGCPQVMHNGVAWVPST